jgi:hypothetical protein
MQREGVQEASRVISSRYLVDDLFPSFLFLLFLFAGLWPLLHPQQLRSSSLHIACPAQALGAGAGRPNSTDRRCILALRRVLASDDYYFLMFVFQSYYLSWYILLVTRA